MTLLEYMRARKIDDDAMARLVGGITGHHVRKLKYGERGASLRVATRIEDLTGGLVRPSDLVLASDRATAERAGAA